MSPSYDYQCEKCGKITTVWKNVGLADRREKCSICGSRKTKRLLGAPGIKIGRYVFPPVRV
jgi:putative FmdB family regulatory protein